MWLFSRDVTSLPCQPNPHPPLTTPGRRPVGPGCSGPQYLPMTQSLCQGRLHGRSESMAVFPRWAFLDQMVGFDFEGRGKGGTMVRIISTVEAPLDLLIPAISFLRHPSQLLCVRVWIRRRKIKKKEEKSLFNCNWFANHEHFCLFSSATEFMFGIVRAINLYLVKQLWVTVRCEGSRMKAVTRWFQL